MALYEYIVPISNTNLDKTRKKNRENRGGTYRQGRPAGKSMTVEEQWLGGFTLPQIHPTGLTSTYIYGTPAGFG